MGDNDRETEKHLRSCGWELQVLGGIGVCASAVHLGRGLTTGAWGTFCERSFSPGVSCLLGAILFLLSVSMLVLGHRIKKRDLGALSAAVFLLWGLTLVLLVNVASAGKGWYELIFFGMVAVFFSMMLLAVRSQQDRGD